MRPNSVYTYIGSAISFLYPTNAVVIRKTEQRLRDGIRLYRKGGRQKTSAEQTLKQQIALKITRRENYPCRFELYKFIIAIRDNLIRQRKEAYVCKSLFEERRF